MTTHQSLDQRDWQPLSDVTLVPDRRRPGFLDEWLARRFTLPRAEGASSFHQKRQAVVSL